MTRPKPLPLTVSDSDWSEDTIADLLGVAEVPRRATLPVQTLTARPCLCSNEGCTA